MSIAEGELQGQLVLGASTGPAAIAVPLLLCEFQRQNSGVRVSLTVSDTHTVVERVASRELELGIVGASRRHRGVRFKPFFSDEVILACPPGHRFEGRAVSVERAPRRAADPDAGGRGSGAVHRGHAASQRRSPSRPRRQARARAPGVRSARGRGRLRGHVHLAHGGRVEPRGGDTRGGAGSGARGDTECLASQATGRSRSRVAEAFVELCTWTAGRMIVRWGLGEVGPLLSELGSTRGAARDQRASCEPRRPRRDAPYCRSPAQPARGRRELLAEVAADADLLVGAGGGNAIDTAKAVSAETGLPLLAVPTTYAGTEWTRHFGMRDEKRRKKPGGTGARTIAIVYEPRLTLDLPLDERVGTALNALAHCAEALYAGPLDDAARSSAHRPPFARRRCERSRRRCADAPATGGAMHAGRALGERGLFLGHAIAQALGGRYDLPHGAMNGLSLPPALRFNEPVVPEAFVRLGEALETEDPVSRGRGVGCARPVWPPARLRRRRRTTCTRSPGMSSSVPVRARTHVQSLRPMPSNSCARSGSHLKSGVERPVRARRRWTRPSSTRVSSPPYRFSPCPWAGQLTGRTTALLPSTDTAAIRLVVAGAKEQRGVGREGAYGVCARSVPETRREVPLRDRLDRWSRGDRAVGLLTRLGMSSAERSAASELRARPKVMKQLRQRGLGARAAASTLVKGVVSACS